MFAVTTLDMFAVTTLECSVNCLCLWSPFPKEIIDMVRHSCGTQLLFEDPLEKQLQHTIDPVVFSSKSPVTIEMSDWIVNTIRHLLLKQSIVHICLKFQDWKHKWPSSSLSNYQLCALDWRDKSSATQCQHHHSQFCVEVIAPIYESISFHT